MGTEQLEQGALTLLLCTFNFLVKMEQHPYRWGKCLYYGSEGTSGNIKHETPLAHTP